MMNLKETISDFIYEHEIKQALTNTHQYHILAKLEAIQDSSQLYHIRVVDNTNMPFRSASFPRNWLSDMEVIAHNPNYWTEIAYCLMLNRSDLGIYDPLTRVLPETKLSDLNLKIKIEEVVKTYDEEGYTYNSGETIECDFNLLNQYFNNKFPVNTQFYHLITEIDGQITEQQYDMERNGSSLHLLHHNLSNVFVETLLDKKINENKNNLYEILPDVMEKLEVMAFNQEELDSFEQLFTKIHQYLRENLDQFPELKEKQSPTLAMA